MCVFALMLGSCEKGKRKAGLEGRLHMLPMWLVSPLNVLFNLSLNVLTN